MSVEPLAAGRPARLPRPDPSTNPLLPTVGAAFEPYLAGGKPGADPGARQAAWTMAEMLRPVVRDLLATAEAPIEGLMIGATEGWLALQILAWGVRGVTVVDPRQEPRERTLRLAAATAADRGQGALRVVADVGEASPRGWDLALLDGREGMPGGDPESVVAATARAGIVVVLSDRCAEARRSLREAGLERAHLIRPPADAERRLVKLEWALIVAQAAAD